MSGPWYYSCRVDNWEKGEIHVREFAGLICLGGGNSRRSEERLSLGEIMRWVRNLAYESWAAPDPGERAWDDLHITLERADGVFLHTGLWEKPEAQS